MLKTVWLTEKQDLSNGCAMLLGGFDGLHVGHRQLLSCAKESGLPVGIMTIVGGKDEKGIFTFQEREDIFKNAGVDFVFELPFSEIKELPPLDFLKLLQRSFSPQLFVCGEDFRFGFHAQGTPALIKEWGQVRVETLPLMEILGKKISSRSLKALLEQGEIEKANALLGEPFFLTGKVIKDRGVGRSLGFPTANILYPADKLSIRKGVYETRIALEGRTYKGITNYGARPTFENEEVRIETYLDGFDGDLYERELKVEFIRYMRDVKRFDSVEDLRLQLMKDIRQVRDQ